MSLRDYRLQIKKAAQKRDGTPVYNGSIDHASILAETIFEYANDHVWILSEKLNARVYGREEVIEQAELFLADPGHTLRVLVEDGSKGNRRDHPFFERFCEHKNVEFRVVPREIAEVFSFNLIAMDGDSYRFEKDKTECAAVAAFGDAENAERVEALFTTVWDESEKVDMKLYA